MPPHFKLNQWRRQAIKKLGEAGYDNPGLETTMLLEHVTGLDRASQILTEDENLGMPQVLKLETYLERRLSGVPLDYIIGQREFYGRPFLVNIHVLSPRPETEMLIDYVLEKTAYDESSSILDLGTGSGAIAVTLLAERPSFSVVAVDLSEEALIVARKNAALHKVDKRAGFHKGSWFGPVSGRFDYIVSNPPYIADDAMRKLAPEVKNYDPNLALSGGRDGLEAYRSIIKDATGYLKPHGHICLEIGFDQGALVPELLSAAAFEDIKLHQDLAGLDRMVTAIAAK